MWSVLEARYHIASQVPGRPVLLRVVTFNANGLRSAPRKGFSRGSLASAPTCGQASAVFFEHAPLAIDYDCALT